MATISVSQILTTSLIVLCFFLFNNKLCLALKSHKHSNHSSSTRSSRWYTAGATWYGAPDGAGSVGGACGYGNIVEEAPFSSLVTGIGPSLYKSGKECGACYQVKCTKHPSCSKKAVRVVITDFCPGGVCLSDVAHFDLSGTAFGAMAKPGQDNNLRDAGVLQIRFARVPCDYSGEKVAFQIDMGSNPNYIAMVIEYEGGDGDLIRVDLQDSGSGQTAGDWWVMNQSWGAVWQLNPGKELHPPFSIRLTSRYSGRVLIAKDVIPTGWQPGATYRSVVNFV